MTERSMFAGFGGQGIISLGQIWVYCAMAEGKNVTFFPFYGAEKRGGVARASVVVSGEAISSPLVTRADSVLVMNNDSMAVCENLLKKGGLMLVNASLVSKRPARADIRVVELPFTGTAESLGDTRVANMVALGALAKLTGALALDGVKAILEKFFPPAKHRFIPLNVAAIEAGQKLAMA